MATKFAWEITSYEVRDRVITLPENHKAGDTTPASEVGVITSIHWKLTGTDKGKSVSHFGFVNVSEAKEQDLMDVKDKDLIKTVQDILGSGVIADEHARIEEQLNPSYK
jgi:hypothetical protein